MNAEIAELSVSVVVMMLLNGAYQTACKAGMKNTVVILEAADSANIISVIFMHIVIPFRVQVVMQKDSAIVATAHANG